MNILLIFRGFIDCHWEAKISTTRKKESCPFYLDYKTNLLQPNHFDTINIYFKPRKTVI